jgi:excisionase family DNA binding protein
MPEDNDPTSPIDSLTDEELISLAEAAKLTGLSQDYLKQIARKGRLRARKIGRNWVTTKTAIEAYLDTRKFIYPKDKPS